MTTEWLTGVPYIQCGHSRQTEVSCCERDPARQCKFLSPMQSSIPLNTRIIDLWNFPRHTLDPASPQVADTTESKTVDKEGGGNCRTVPVLSAKLC